MDPAVEARTIRKVIEVMKARLGELQELCPHEAMTFVGDAHDEEYACDACDKRWFNKVPHVVARVAACNGKTYRLDGNGGVIEITA